MNIVSKVMRDLRLNKKLSQKHIAKELGITRQGYSRYETGDREPGLETITFLAKYYDVPVQTFFMKEEKSYKYENLFMAELGVLYDKKYREVLNIRNYLMFNEVEKIDGFAYDKKNQVSNTELKEIEKLFDTSMEQLDKIGKEITKTMNYDKEYFDRKKLHELLHEMYDFNKK